MVHKTLLLYFKLCSFLVVGSISDTEQNGYSGEVGALFRDLTDFQNIIKNAKEKSNTFINATWDKKYAIAIINLYTKQSTFFSKLNSQMRNNYPDNTTDIWKRSGYLINKGLDILGQTVHKLVFRGCGKLSIDPVAGENFMFNQITSTSTSRKTAENFINCHSGHLFQISNVYGVSVEMFSAFAFEAEVIVKSCNIYKVEKGPVKEGGYNVYYLDGQPKVNGNDKECEWDVRSDREHPWNVNDANRNVNGFHRNVTGSNRNVNGSKRQHVGILQTSPAVFVILIILCQKKNVILF